MKETWKKRLLDICEITELQLNTQVQSNPLFQFSSENLHRGLTFLSVNWDAGINGCQIFQNLQTETNRYKEDHNITCTKVKLLRNH